MSNAQNAAIDAALSKVLAAFDSSNLAKECFYDLAGLFDAIIKQTEKHSNVHKLAKIGSYLANDWGSLNDCNCGDLEDEEKTLRALKQTAA